jgi:hypothetical protein
MSDNGPNEYDNTASPASREVLRPELIDEHGHTTGGNAHNEYQGSAYGAELIGVDSGAALSLILAIASWIVIPIVGAIAALFMAPLAKRRIRRSQGALAGHTLAVAAQVIAVLNLVFAALIIWIFVHIIHWLFG